MGYLRQRTGRAALAALGCAAVAILGSAAPAAADVTVTPAQANQGDAGQLRFTVANDHPSAAVNRIELRMPADNPVAEVYPLSVPKWAPRITTRPAQQSLASLHGGRVTDVTSAITWTAGPGVLLEPGESVELAIALGPLPGTPQLAMTIEQSFAGTATVPPPVTSQVALTLLAATGPAAPAGGHGHAAGPAGAPAAQQPASAAGAGDPVKAPATGTNWWSMAGWVCAALITVCALVAARRSRRDDPAPGAAATAAPTPGPAGAAAAAADAGTGTTATPPAGADRQPAVPAAVRRRPATNRQPTKRQGATRNGAAAPDTAAPAQRNRANNRDRSAEQPGTAGAEPVAASGRWAYRHQR